MAGILILPLIAVLFLVLKSVYRFVWNYIHASRTGLPFITLPFDQNGFLWMIVSVSNRQRLQSLLPARIWNRIKYGIYGWEHYEKLAPFHQCEGALKDKRAPGRSFLLSSTGRLEFWTSSSNAAQQILLRPRDFQQLDLSDLFVGVFGPNINCLNRDEWSRHRKVIASAVTERISPVVWTESIERTKDMLEDVFSDSDSQQQQETLHFFDMVKSIAVHVLGKAGLGAEQIWTPQAQISKSGGEKSEVSYMDAVKLVNENMAGPIVLPTKALLNWPSFLPDYQNLRRLGLAKAFFPVRTREMVAQEKERILNAGKTTSEGTTNLMRSLIAASEVPEAGAKDSASTKPKFTMTEEELVANLFLITAAGYDTTANTISYAIVLLIRYPKWQQWLLEEVDCILAANPDKSVEDTLSNYHTFHKCARILSFMFETLRFFAPLIHMPKMVKDHQTLLDDEGRQFVLPPGTTVYVDNIALHLEATVWRDLNRHPSDIDDGEQDMPGRHGATPRDIELGGGKLGDEWKFRPSRWISPDAAPVGQLRHESLYQPPRGTFIPWSMGPRICPGYRMAQVEFIAVILSILSRYRIEAVAYANEDIAAVNKRLDRTMHMSISKLALEMDVYDKTDDGSQSQTPPDTGIKVRLVKR